MSLPVRRAAVALAFLSACDFEGAFNRYCEGNPACPPDAGAKWTPRSCEHPSDCREGNELCHPVGHVCVPTCTSNSDCPAEQSSCAFVNDPDGQPSQQKVCTCQSAQSCASANPQNTCSFVDNVCEPLCSGDGDCAAFRPDRVCDLASGVCLNQPSTCTSNSECKDAKQARCDPSSQRCTRCLSSADCAGRSDGRSDCDSHGSCTRPQSCDPARTAPGPNGGPDDCRYGQICAGGNDCAPVPSGSCYGAVNLQWDQSRRGPVIVAATASASPDSSATECAGGGWKMTAVIQFYAPSGLTYPDLTSLAARVTFQNPTGAGPAGGRSAASFVSSASASGAAAGSITAGLCGISDGGGWSVFLTDGAGNSGNVSCLR